MTVLSDADFGRKESVDSLEIIPSGPISPEEFWQDDPCKDEKHYNLYISAEGNVSQRDTPPWGFEINQEVIDWLNTAVGTREAKGLEWYQNLDQDLFDWSIRGIITYKSSRCLQIMIKDPGKAMLFKLRWHGL